MGKMSNGVNMKCKEKIIKKINMYTNEDWSESLNLGDAILKTAIEEIIVKKINEIIREINKINKLIKGLYSKSIPIPTTTSSKAHFEKGNPIEVSNSKKASKSYGTQLREISKRSNNGGNR